MNESITIPMFPSLRLCHCGRIIKLKGHKLCGKCTSVQYGTGNNSWLEKHRNYMRQTGFDARCKQLGVTKEQYYQVLKEKDEKKQQLRKELKQQRLALQDMKRQQKEKLKADYLDQQKQIDTQEGEEWRNIPDYSKYEVSSLGRFRNKKTGRIMARKVSDHTHGYAMVGMHRDSKGKQHTSLAHRIVALVFVPNLSDKSTVNHINHVRDDNRVSNLEWATQSENATASIHYYEHDINPDQ